MAMEQSAILVQVKRVCTGKELFMSDISSVSSLSDLSRDMYYQYLIDHNSMSTMFNAISGNSDDSSDSSGIMNAIGSGLGYSLSSLNGVQGPDSLSGLSGTSGSDDSLLGLSQRISGFAGILQSYLTAQTTEASQMADSMASVLEEAAQTEDTSSLTYRTVQEIYQYFQEQSRKPASLL